MLQTWCNLCKMETENILKGNIVHIEVTRIVLSFIVLATQPERVFSYSCVCAASWCEGTLGNSALRWQTTKWNENENNKIDLSQDLLCGETVVETSSLENRRDISVEYSPKRVPPWGWDHGLCIKATALCRKLLSFLTVPLFEWTQLPTILKSC